MLQEFDSAQVITDNNVQAARQEWMKLLSRAPQEMLEQSLSQHVHAQPQWLRQPEIGLMMIQGRTGGSGERFNLGEITVTRCALKLTDSSLQGHVGVSYVLGRNHRRAKLAAIADALLQEPAQREQLEITLLRPVRLHLQQLMIARTKRAQSTKVDFMTVAREAGTNGSEDEE